MSDTTIINYNEIDIFLKKSFEYEYDENLLEFKAPTPDYDSQILDHYGEKVI